MPDDEQQPIEGEPSYLTYDDIARWNASRPKCEQCQERPKSKHFIGFYDPHEADAVKSAGYYRDHLCFQCYLGLMHAYFCTPAEDQA